MTKHSSVSTPPNKQQNQAAKPLRRSRLPLSDTVKERARKIIRNKAIDANIRAAVRYGCEINDPWTPELVRRVEAGEPILEGLRSRK